MKSKLFKSVIMLGLLLMTATSAIFAQNGKAFYRTSYKHRNSGSFSKHASILSLGFGVPNRTGTGVDAWDDGDGRAGFGPGYIKYEHGIIDELGLGGYAALAAARYKYGPNNRFTDHAFSYSMGFLAYYHFNKLIPVRNLDVYAGAGLAFRHFLYSYDDDIAGSDNNYSNVDVYPTIKVGARYYFTHSFGVYAEGGYDDMSDVNLGVTFRF